MAVSTQAGTIQAEYIYFGGQRIARRDESGAVYYFFPDHLGSLRVLTNGTGQIQRDADFYPYGGERVVTGIVDDPNKFAGMYYDTESALYHTLYRKYSSTLGRWLSADPERCCEDNPQAFDRYTYVLDNPTNLIDPLGLQGCGPFDPDCDFAPREPGFVDVVGLPVCGGHNRGGIVMTYTCTMILGPRRILGDCHYAGVCGMPPTVSASSYPFNIIVIVGMEWVKERCDRPDLKKCPPRKAIKASVRVREWPPPPIILTEDVDVDCTKIP